MPASATSSNQARASQRPAVFVLACMEELEIFCVAPLSPFRRLAHKRSKSVVRNTPGRQGHGQSYKAVRTLGRYDIRPCEAIRWREI
jgi:hypothetical protein